MSGAIFVPEHAWQPTGQSRVDALKASGKARTFYNSLSDVEKRALKYKWNFWARPAQIMPPDNAVPHRLGWKYWNNLAGRGYGKTRVAAEAVRALVEGERVKRIALVGPTYRDVLQTMIKGERFWFVKTTLKIYQDSTRNDITEQCSISENLV